MTDLATEPGRATGEPPAVEAPVPGPAPAPPLSPAAPERGTTTAYALGCLGAVLAGLGLALGSGAVPVGAPPWRPTAFWIVFAAVLLPTGRLADRRGHRAVFLAGTGLSAAGSLLSLFTETGPVLDGARLLQAAGVAALMPPSLVLVLTARSQSNRAQAARQVTRSEAARSQASAAGCWAAVAAVAAVAGALLGTEYASRLVWAAPAAIGLVALVLSWRVVPAAPAALRPLGPDLAGAGISVAAVALLVLGVRWGSDWGWTPPRVLGVLLAALGLAGASAVRSPVRLRSSA